MSRRRRSPWRTPFAISVAIPLSAGLLVLLVSLAEGARETSPIPATRDSVRTLLEARRFTQADTIASRLVRTIQASGEKDSLRIAEAFDLAVESAWRAGRGARPGLRELAERSLGIKERRLKPEDVGVAVSRVNLGVVFLQLGEPEVAHPQLSRALDVQRRALGEENLAVAGTLAHLASCFSLEGNADEARKMQERALAIREKLLPPDHPTIAETVTDLATFASEQGNYAYAQSLYRRSITIYERLYGAENPNSLLALINLARLQYLMGDFAVARASFEKALATQRKTLAPYDRQIGFTLTYLGLVLDALGDSEAAVDSLNRALLVRTKALGPDHANVAMTLGALAEVHTHLEDYDESLPLLERALQIRVKVLGSDHPNVGITLMDLSNVLLKTGNEARAESTAVRADSILEAVYGPKHHAVAQALRNIAVIRMHHGDIAGSVDLLERSRAIQVELSGDDYPEVAETNVLLAQAHLAHGDTVLALDAALQAESVSRNHVRLTERNLSEREALRYAAVRVSGLDIALSLAERGLPDTLLRRVMDGVVRSRALVLDEIGERHRDLFSESADTLDARLASDLADASRKLAALMVRGPEGAYPERFRRDLDQARRSRELAERALAERNAAFRRESSVSRAGLDDILAILPPKGALVSFIAYRRTSSGMSDPRTGSAKGEETWAYSACVVADGGRTIRFIPLGSAKKIEDVVAVWSDQIRRGTGRSAGSESSYRTAGLALRRAVWDPIAPSMRGATRVFVVPDGAINLVSFGALPLPGGRYMVEAEPIVHYLSAERDLAIGAPPTFMKGILAVGGADFDRRRAPEGRAASIGTAGHAGPTYRGAASSCGSFRSLRFSPLPGTAREVSEVLGIWRDTSGDAVSSALTGLDATEDAVKSWAPRFGVLHLATHGFFVARDCATRRDRMRGMGEIVSMPDPRYQGKAKGDRSKPTQGSSGSSESPLLLSGLVLAGANQRDSAPSTEEDGILTAEEIAAMDLSGVRLAVLSACDTGAGESVFGEGVLGLRRAFQIAGARTLILSLWSLEDRAAGEWMAAFYRSLLIRRRDVSEAARDASRVLLSQRRAHGQTTHPFYWAGFLAAGDWR